MITGRHDKQGTDKVIIHFYPSLCSPLSFLYPSPPYQPDEVFSPYAIPATLDYIPDNDYHHPHTPYEYDCSPYPSPQDWSELPTYGGMEVEEWIQQNIEYLGEDDGHHAVLSLSPSSSSSSHTDWVNTYSREDQCYKYHVCK